MSINFNNSRGYTGQDIGASFMVVSLLVQALETGDGTDKNNVTTIPLSTHHEYVSAKKYTYTPHEIFVGQAMRETTSTLLENPDTEFNTLISFTDSLATDFPEITEEERNQVQQITQLNNEEIQVVRAGLLDNKEMTYIFLFALLVALLGLGSKVISNNVSDSISDRVHHMKKATQKTVGAGLNFVAIGGISMGGLVLVYLYLKEHTGLDISFKAFMLGGGGLLIAFLIRNNPKLAFALLLGGFLLYNNVDFSPSQAFRDPKTGEALLPTNGTTKGSKTHTPTTHNENRGSQEEKIGASVYDPDYATYTDDTTPHIDPKQQVSDQHPQVQEALEKIQDELFGRDGLLYHIGIYNVEKTKNIALYENNQLVVSCDIAYTNKQVVLREDANYTETASMVDKVTYTITLYTTETPFTFTVQGEEQSLFNDMTGPSFASIWQTTAKDGEKFRVLNTLQRILEKGNRVFDESTVDRVEKLQGKKPAPGIEIKVTERTW